jgi:hypothetical protein
MNEEIKNIFEQQCELINKTERDEIARVTRDARDNGAFLSVMFFKLIYETREKALHQRTMALINTYKQANTSPDSTIINKTKEEIETAIDTGLVSLAHSIRQSFDQASSTSKLEAQLSNKLQPSKQWIIKDAFREIDIWAGLDNKKSITKSSKISTFFKNIWKTVKGNDSD